MNVIKTPISGKVLLRNILIACGFLFLSALLWVYFSLGNLRHLSLYIPNITGFPFGGKQYLVLLQNNTELRPTGGFISSFAEVSFDFGIIPKIDIHDVYSLKGYKDAMKEEAPYPMGDLLASENYLGHSFHDANWYPNLPTSSKDILSFYNAEFPNKKIDGVITLNYVAVEQLLGVIGQLRIEGKTLDKNNLFAEIEYTQNNIDKHNIQEIEERKSILSTLAPALIKHVVFHPEQLHTIANTIHSTLESKDIAVYFKDEMLQERMTSSGWTNLFPTPQPHRDIFAVVVANLGGMKSDRYIKRRYTKTLQVEYDGETSEKKSIIVTQRLHFDHHGSINPPLSNTFVGYVRSYIPKEASFIDIGDNVDTYEELGYTTLGKKIEISPGSSTDITFSYRLPEAYLDDHYNSYIYKQSGALSTTHEVAITLPGDMTFVGKDMEIRENTAWYSSTSPKDESLSIEIKNDARPPRVVHQQFIDYNRILLEFNEPILSYDCTSKDNYALLDSDEIVPTVSNKPTILRVECKGRSATIFTQGIRTQYGEFFKLTLRNLRDANNNIIDSNPKTITVVQRFSDDAPDNITRP